MTQIYSSIGLICLFTVQFVLAIMVHNYLAAINIFIVGLYIIKDLIKEVSEI